ncbi:extracellular solute-binding protein [Nocardioides zeae]|uniref:Extracellular solute-binding protein n=1 Tax=Nocardioides imazamoxiresistens TaxID=3231893 RepID=A0ABU3Q089_9ACTN|nr:extracellular solute-binding protein [Nocardioides zeae]MDT9594856.1 extracellular solute-binding protein [Nocardioides zeae]
MFQRPLRPRALAAGAVVSSLALTLSACASAGGSGNSEDRFDIVGFAVPEAANDAIITEFVKTDGAEGLTEADFSGSYGASGDQSRAVVNGTDADYVHFSLEGDVTRLVDEGLVADDWNEGPNAGIVSSSVAVLVVEEGNPLGITGWEDLTRDDVELVTADPDSSGAARWNILAAYGSAIAGGASETEAEDYLVDVFDNVTTWATSGREATEAFENGLGNVLISYENEAILTRQQGRTYDYVVPDSTLLIENPGAILEDAHPAAEAWLDFVLSDAGQTEFVRKGFRPVGDVEVDVEVEGANDPSNPFPEPTTLLTIADDFGGWDAVNEKWWAEGALYQQLRER